MAKSAEAFRTISEVAEWLDTPAHVLRFWESKFAQVKPVKRAGGRRYYRPDDMSLLGGIKKLLHEDGMTIKGVQKLLREKGIKHVAALAPLLGEETDPAVAETAVESVRIAVEAAPTQEAPVAEPQPAPAAEPVATAPSEPEPQPTEATQTAPADPPAPAPETAPTPRALALLANLSDEEIRARSGDLRPVMDRLDDIVRRLRSA